MKVVVACVVIALAVALDCKFTKDGATYDPSRLTLEEGDYVVSGKRLSGTPIKIVFNVCKDVNVVPKDHDGGDACVETVRQFKVTDPVKTDEPSPVFITPTPDTYNPRPCARYAAPAAKSSMGDAALYDPEYPDAGFVLQYLDGDYCCPGGPCQVASSEQTKFRTSFLCSKAVTPLEEELYPSVINDGCDVRVTFRTGFACPTECPIVAGYVCGQHGTCGYDRISKKARCYCDTNYSGGDCSKYVNEKLLDVNTWIIVATIVLVVILISSILYVYLRLSKIRVNPDSFESLEKKFNELGHMAY